jgi:hypothetical protein
MAASIKFLPGATVRWQARRYVIVDYAGLDAYLSWGAKSENVSSNVSPLVKRNSTKPLAIVQCGHQIWYLCQRTRGNPRSRTSRRSGALFSGLDCLSQSLQLFNLRVAISVVSQSQVIMLKTPSVAFNYRSDNC